MAGRPELARALGDLDAGDELVIAEWDRATRSMWDGLQIIKAVIDAGASIKVLDRSYIDLETPMGRGFMAMMSAMAEDERLRIIKRTHEGRKIAQAKGVRMGRKPKLTPHQIEEARADRRGRDDARPRQELRCKRQHDFEARLMSAKQAIMGNVAVIYDEFRICDLFNSNLKEACDKLTKLQVYCGRSPTFTGLSGWVYGADCALLHQAGIATP